MGRGFLDSRGRPALFEDSTGVPFAVRFRLGQKSIAEFLTHPQHEHDPLHKRLVNPLSAEFGAYKRQDLDYLLSTGLSNLKLVSLFLPLFILARVGRKQSGLGFGVLAVAAGCGYCSWQAFTTSNVFQSRSACCMLASAHDNNSHTFFSFSL